MSIYAISMVAAAGVAFAGGLFVSHQLRLSFVKSGICLVIGALAVWTGAKLWYQLAWLSSKAQPISNPDFGWFSAGGGSLYGGLVLGIFVAGTVARMLRVDMARLADASSVSFLLGVAVVRLGCWQVGCCFGVPTELPWGVKPDIGQPAWFFQIASNPFNAVQAPHRIHPTQLYELGAALFAGMVASVSLIRKLPAGVAASLAGASFTLARWLILPFRQYDLGGEFERTTYQILYPLLVLVFSVLAAWLWIRSPQRFNLGAGNGSHD
jgi:prolipoprotein diacylglyceryltransferase